MARRIDTRARFARPCAACPHLIAAGDQIVLRKGQWIHATCASGADD